MLKWTKPNSVWRTGCKLYPFTAFKPNNSFQMFSRKVPAMPWQQHELRTHTHTLATSSTSHVCATYRFTKLYLHACTQRQTDLDCRATQLFTNTVVFVFYIVRCCIECQTKKRHEHVFWLRSQRYVTINSSNKHVELIAITNTTRDGTKIENWNTKKKHNPSIPVFPTMSEQCFVMCAVIACYISRKLVGSCSLTGTRCLANSFCEILIRLNGIVRFNGWKRLIGQSLAWMKC